MRECRLLLTCLLCLATLLQTGCAYSTAPKSTRYYSLAPLVEPVPQMGGIGSERTRSILVEPVELPEYLRQQQIMVRYGSNEFRQSPYHLWAEPLDMNVTRVVAANLRALLPEELVVTSMPKGMTPYCSLKIEVSRFDGALGSKAVLDVSWTAFDTAGKRAIARNVSTYSMDIPFGDYSYDGLITAMNRVVLAFSQDIARDMRAPLAAMRDLAPEPRAAAEVEESGTSPDAASPMPPIQLARDSDVRAEHLWRKQ